MTCTCSTTRHASTRSRRSRDTCRAGSQMILSARGGPVFPLGALRARGLALEIGPADLRMDEAAARQLLSASGVELPDEQLTELTEHTEGWPAGLYLAALSIRARGLKAAGAATFSGSDRLVSDYLQSELLAHVSAEDVRFLTRTAVLERMSGPLCDAVLEANGSAAILESRARSNLFLVPLDAHGEWYRYHHLFRELLRAELVRAEPELVPRLLARAADWCEANGQPEAAIGYAQEAGDVDRAARLVEQLAIPAYQSGHVATAERWLDWLERNGALERNAAVAVLGALDATAQGRPAEAERWAEAAERASYEGTLPDGSASIDSWRAVLRAMRCRRGVARMRADAEFAVRTLARSSPLRPSALLLYALSRWLAGEVDEADDLLADVAEEGLELGSGRGGRGGSRRARRGRDRARSVGRGRGVRRPGASGDPPVGGWGSTRRARSPMRWRPASRSIVAKPSVLTSSWLGRSACVRGSPTPRRTLPSRPAWSSRGPTWRSPMRAAPRRCCARSTRSCVANQTSARSRPRPRSCAPG